MLPSEANMSRGNPVLLSAGFVTRVAAFIFDLLIIAACPGVRSRAVAAKLKVCPSTFTIADRICSGGY